MSEHYESVLRRHILNYDPFIVPTKSSWWPIGVDFLLRIISLTLDYTKIISFSHFIQQQIFIIPIITIAFGTIRSWHIVNKISNRINTKLNSSSPSMRIIVAIIIVTIINCFLIDNALDERTSFSWGLKLFYEVLFGLFYLLFLVFIIVYFSPSTKISGEIKFYPFELANYYCLQESTLNKINNNEFFVSQEKGEVESDINDIQLTILETNAKNISGRIEIFTIESVFIGALAFSAFISIISSDNVQQEISKLKELPNLYLDFINYFSIFQIERCLITWDKLSVGVYLLGTLAFETLICSIFFILVLVNKMRLSANIDKLNHIVNLANRYNAKEEEINYLSLQKVPNLKTRQRFLTKKMRALVEDGKKVYDSISPLYKIVSMLRSLGLYTFFLVLMTGGLFYSGFLAIGIFLSFILINVIRYLTSESSIRLINLIFEMNHPRKKAPENRENV